MAMIKLYSTSAFTQAHVADLRTIHDKLQQLVERAETIIQRSDEVFPAARGSWLRKMKAALGLLHTKDGQTLEDTILLCERLTSASAYKSGPEQTFDSEAEVTAWAQKNQYMFRIGKVRSKLFPVGCKAAAVRSGKKTLGTVNRTQGQLVFIKSTYYD